MRFSAYLWVNTADIASVVSHASDLNDRPGIGLHGREMNFVWLESYSYETEKGLFEVWALQIFN